MTKSKKNTSDTPQPLNREKIYKEMLAIKPQDHQTANNLFGTLTQDLYERLKQKGHITPITMFETGEGVPSPDNSTEDTTRILRELSTIIEAV